MAFPHRVVPQVTKTQSSGEGCKILLSESIRERAAFNGVRGSRRHRACGALDPVDRKLFFAAPSRRWAERTKCVCCSKKPAASSKSPAGEQHASAGLQHSQVAVGQQCCGRP